MGRYIGPVCKKCRRDNIKLFLKGTRCMSEKCALERRAVSSRTPVVRRSSDYILQLREKQKVKLIYGIPESQFFNYFKQARKKRAQIGEALLMLIEKRLDNVIYRGGFCSSHRHARQIVTHGHIYVNGKKVNKPSFAVKENDIIEIKLKNLKGERTPANWLEVDDKKNQIKVLRLPTREDIDPTIEEDRIVAFYSK